MIFIKELGSQFYLSVEVWNWYKLQKTPLCVTFVAKCNFWEWEWTFLASFAFGKPCLFDLVCEELMCQLCFMRFSFHTRWVHIEYWNHFLYQIFCTFGFWFLIFFWGTKSTNLWVIWFNFCLKKRGYVFSQWLRT